ncbi:deoxyhypusine hydroxylase-like [Acropora millepora]|uniref:deoxyhypusine hydroxylase-like n=1 Tax=Acropora millepora TaxID=45264 RepID=UPI001CF35D34|nr:deoxyhypusine hydroxylase-like [Acropora millepora]
MVNLSPVQQIGVQLADQSQPLTNRFRALFTLRNLGGHEAIDCISKCFDDPSALLKHELAYCLGQMQDEYAIPYLIRVLKDKKQEAMVRHEAGEALGAIGSPEVLNVLREYASDPQIEVAETCQLALQRIEWLNEKSSRESKNLSTNPYKSIDPAPPSQTEDTETLKNILLDESRPLFERYRAMFSLRNKGDEDSVLALADGLKCRSALFRHEIAYVLGQMQHEAAIPQLIENLEDLKESAMVRHECAEALGSIAKDQCLTALEKYSKDQERVVKESCVVALDMYNYEQSKDFQYADSLVKMKET